MRSRPKPCAKGIFLASIHDLYMARGKGQGKNFTVPAMNLRSLTYYLARAIFRTAKRLNAGAFIFEIAKLKWVIPVKRLLNMSV